MNFVYTIIFKILNLFLRLIRFIYCRSVLTILVVLLSIILILDKKQNSIEPNYLDIYEEARNSAKEVICDKVKFGNLKKIHKFIGKITPIKQIDLVCRMNNGGIINSIYVKSGQRIQEGCRIVDFDVKEQHEELKLGHGKLKKMKEKKEIIAGLSKEFSKLEKLTSDINFIDERRYVARSAGEMNKGMINALFSGVVEFTPIVNEDRKFSKYVSEGQFIKFGQKFGHLIDDSKVCVEFFVDPSLIETYIFKGTIISLSYKERSLEAKIVEYNTSIDASNNKCYVKAEILSNDKASLPKINEMVNVFVNGKECKDVYILPIECVESSGTENYIFKVVPSFSKNVQSLVQLKTNIDVRVVNNKEVGFTSLKVKTGDTVVKYGQKVDRSKVKEILK